MLIFVTYRRFPRHTRPYVASKNVSDARTVESNEGMCRVQFAIPEERKILSRKSSTSRAFSRFFITKMTRIILSTKKGESFLL